MRYVFGIVDLGFGGIGNLHGLGCFLGDIESRSEVEGNQTRTHGYGAYKGESSLFVYSYCGCFGADIYERGAEFLFVGCEYKVGNGGGAYDICYLAGVDSIVFDAVEVLACLLAAGDHDKFATELSPKVPTGLRTAALLT